MYTLKLCYDVEQLAADMSPEFAYLGEKASQIKNRLVERLKDGSYRMAPPKTQVDLETPVMLDTNHYFWLELLLDMRGHGGSTAGGSSEEEREEFNGMRSSTSRERRTGQGYYARYQQDGRGDRAGRVLSGGRAASAGTSDAVYSEDFYNAHSREDSFRDEHEQSRSSFSPPRYEEDEKRYRYRYQSSTAYETKVFSNALDLPIFSRSPFDYAFRGRGAEEGSVLDMEGGGNDRRGRISDGVGGYFEEESRGGSYDPRSSRDRASYQDNGSFEGGGGPPLDQSFHHQSTSSSVYDRGSYAPSYNAAGSRDVSPRRFDVGRDGSFGADHRGHHRGRSRSGDEVRTDCFLQSLFTTGGIACA